MAYKDTQLANHTHPLVYEYHRCEHCGKIHESREDYLKQDGGVWKKHLVCPRCHKAYTLKKKLSPIVGA